MNLVFLDFDGVLNDCEHFINTSDFRKNISDSLGFIKMEMELDIDKIMLLRELIDYSSAQVVVISSWASLSNFYKIKDYLESLGIPIIDWNHNNINRVDYINECLIKYDVSNFVIIDDDFFKGYDQFYGYLVKPSFQFGGLNEEDIEEAEYILGRS